MKSVMKKMFAVCAAAAAITTVSAMAVSAEGITATPNTSNESVVVKLSSGSSVSDEAAIIIFKKSSDEDKNATPTDDMIVYLNQQAAADAQASGFLSGAEVLPKTLEKDATYVVRVGDSTNDKFYEAEFTYGEKPGSTRLLGNVNDDVIISTSDAYTVIRHVVNKQHLHGDYLQAADTNDDGSVTTADAFEIVKYVVGKDSKVDGVKTVSDKTNTVEDKE